MAVQRFGDYTYTSSTTTSVYTPNADFLMWSNQVRAIMQENPRAELVKRMIPRQDGFGVDFEVHLVYPKTGNKVPLPPLPR